MLTGKKNTAGKEERRERTNEKTSSEQSKADYNLASLRFAGRSSSFFRMLAAVAVAVAVLAAAVAAAVLAAAAVFVAAATVATGSDAFAVSNVAISMGGNPVQSRMIFSPPL